MFAFLLFGVSKEQSFFFLIFQFTFEKQKEIYVGKMN